MPLSGGRRPWRLLSLALAGSFPLLFGRAEARGNTPLRRQRLYMDNASSPQLYRAGFRYPRLDARLHNGDKVKLSSTSHKTWLFVDTSNPASSSFRTLGQTSDPKLAATFAIDRTSMRSPVVSLWCMGQASYMSVRASDGAVGCFSASPVAFSYVRIDGQKWWDASRGSLQDPSTGRFLRLEAPGPLGAGAVSFRGPDTSGWQLLSVTLTAGYEMVYPLVRGVNLGNWFVLERWMSNELFVDESGKHFTERCAVLDEQGLMQRLRPETRRARMEKHWSTWVTEKDIRWLADSGINTVRVPFGYWMTHPEPPFIEGQFVYLQRLFKWCERYSVAILLDFHGLKGSQNGVDSSGNCGACGQEGCGDTKHRFLEAEERKLNLAVIANLSAHFAGEPALLGFGLANEVGRPCDRYELMSFYQMAFDLIRAQSPDALVVVGGLFSPSTYPFLREAGMVQDEHMYFSVISDGAIADQHANLETATRRLTGHPRWPVLVGEWSLDHHKFDLRRLALAEQERWLKNFGAAQLQAYEQHSMGWVYWNYKVGAEVSPTWSFSAMCKRGILPGCVPGANYGPSEWWRDRASAASYVDRDEASGVRTVKVGPYVVTDAGKNSCPPGSEPLTAEECRLMPEEFGGTLHHPFKAKYSSDPKGCFKFQGTYYFNEHPVGAARAARSPHCKLTCKPDFVAGESSADKCPSDTLPLNETECREAVKEFGSSLHAGVVSDPAAPAGCFRFGSRLYFNKHPQGAGSFGKTPFCRRPCSIEYVVSSDGSNHCPPGSKEIDENECHWALGLLGPAMGPFVETKEADPKGCFRYDKGFYYNKHPVGSPLPHRTPVCKQTQKSRRTAPEAPPEERPALPAAASEESNFVTGRPGSTGCPEAHVPLTEEECSRMPEELGGKLNTPFLEDLADDPKGCFSFDRGFYFNTHPVGAPRAMRAPVCKRAGAPAIRPSQTPASNVLGPRLPQPLDPSVADVALAAAAMLGSRGGHFVPGSPGSNGCPPNTALLDEAECWEVPKEFGVQGTLPSIFVEDAAEDPRGCFQFQEGFYFNKHPVGSPRLGRKPYCRSSGSSSLGLAPPSGAPMKLGEPFARREGYTVHRSFIQGSYVAGEPGTNACPADTLALTQLECKSLPQEFIGVLHDPFVEYLPDDPRGCFKFERGFYFNKHPIGAARSGRTPYCRTSSATIFE